MDFQRAVASWSPSLWRHHNTRYAIILPFQPEKRWRLVRAILYGGLEDFTWVEIKSRHRCLNEVHVTSVRKRIAQQMSGFTARLKGTWNSIMFQFLAETQRHRINHNHGDFHPTLTASPTPTASLSGLLSVVDGMVEAAAGFPPRAPGE